MHSRFLHGTLLTHIGIEDMSMSLCTCVPAHIHCLLKYSERIQLSCILEIKSTVKCSLEFVNLKCSFNVSQLLTEGSFRIFIDNTFVSYNTHAAFVLEDN